MAKIKNVKTKLFDELKELAESRTSIESYHFNFLQNFYENSKVIHFHIKEKTEKSILEIMYRQYFVFLISCWETYFRDVFLLTYASDESLMCELLENFEIDDSVLEQLNSNNMEVIDLLSKKFNFQNLDSLNNAFSILISDDDFLEYICTYQIEFCGINGKQVSNLSVDSLFLNWKELITKTFEIRHKVIHDANYRPSFDIHFIQQVEGLFLLVPQISTYVITKNLI